MHLNYQPEARAGGQPDAMAGVPPVEAPVSSWFLPAREPPDYGLRDFATHYTMQSELDVHQGLTPGAPAEQPDSPSTDAGELGENVEFF